MAHLIEAAVSGRAKCRGCGARIEAGEERFGERLPNPFTDDGGEMTHWFHLWCAAYRRPEAFLETVAAPGTARTDLTEQVEAAKLSMAHRRLPRVNVAERSPSGRARCRACRELIDKDLWRISLVYYEDGRFSPSGFIHATCAAAYLETADVLDRLRHFTPSLTDADARELSAALEA